MKLIRKNAKAGILCLNLIVSIIAFAFLIGVSGEFVSGQESNFDKTGLGDREGGGATAGIGGSALLTLTSGEKAAVQGTKLYLNPGRIETLEFIDGQGKLITSSAKDVKSITQLKDGGSMIKTTKGSGTISAENTQKYIETGQLEEKPGSSTVSKFLKLPTGGGLDAIFSGAQWAVMGYGVGYMLGSLFGMSKQNTQAVSTALSVALGGYKAAATWHSTTGTLLANPLVWAGIGVAVFVLMYKKTDTKIVTFDCMPWQAPTGGNDCEKCNDATLPCSEYRCRSLGQNCELINQGTTQEKCVNVNPRDVNPPVIMPNYNVITEGHQYTNVRTSPPGPGFNIVNMNSSDGCLKAFTPLKFGITTNEPAQCKIDFNQTEKFDNMLAFVGGSNLYSYNHTEVFSLPGAKEFEGSGIILENGKDLNFFIRCKDRNGNENTAEYAVRFCIDSSPDTTAPIVRATSILNRGCIAENQDAVEVDFYTNEPANCKWSFDDQSYENMQNEMVCLNEMYQLNALQLFTCRTTLTGIKREGTNYYVRCEDQPTASENDRNRNRESFVFNLRGSTGLKISQASPNGTIFGGVNPTPVELYVQTLFGCDNGQSICYYSTTNNAGDFIMFFDTNNDDGVSTQKQSLSAGSHRYYIECIDAGGNVARETLKFNLEIDTSAPAIARIYEEDNMLKLVTIRNSECAYSFLNCDFSFDEGVEMPYANTTNHIAEWNKDKTYYIKCRDEFRNEDAQCSAIVRPSDNLLKYF